MKKVILCPNPYRDKDLAATREAAGLLAEGGIETVVCVPFRYDDHLSTQGLNLQPLQQELRSSQMIIAFGGDGTILHLAKTAALRNIPMLGVNLGSLGFISELEQDELPLLRNLARGEYETESRMMLDVNVIREGRQIYNNLALNEATIIKGPVSRVIRLRVYADGDKLTDVKGDGVIAASPTGSTAYSLSAGGPILEPTAQNLLITPLCAHNIDANSHVFVLSTERTVTIETMDKTRKPVFLCVDNARNFALRPGDRVQVRRSRHALKLIRLSGKSLCQILEKKKQAGGADDEK